ncbi:hypothetical protein [Mesobacillus subterraneus]|uniref:Uncharacterized protein n=1 Tax=Mesobacillus subterraneus TaxID=285983 RepID=A0A427TW36_9BACI|nr:hypothetical protein [Mesobacillus subterraneus]RSD28717.1 hypothetical protein EJA10_03845 [Mesobacillus subterraneus]
MSEPVGMIITILVNIALFGLANYFAIKHSVQNVKKRIAAGIIFLLCTPAVFFITLYIGALWDDSGWGAGIVTVIASGLYILNGLGMLLSSIHIHFSKT